MKKLYKCTHNLYIRVVEYFRYDLRKGKVRMNMRKRLVTAAAVILSAAAFIGKPIKADAMAQSKSWRNYLTETGYYYEQLSSVQKEFYRQHGQGMAQNGYELGNVDVPGDMSVGEFNDLNSTAQEAFRYDHPAIFTYVNNEHTNILVDGIKMDQTLNQAAGIASRVSGLDPSAKVKYFYEYLANTVSYNNNGAYKQNAYGALIDKRAVCEGYAKAFSLLCHMANIECITRYGDALGIPHAWNTVKLEDGEWYDVDSTWGDDGDGLPPTYEFFLLTKTQMSNKYHIYYEEQGTDSNNYYYKLTPPVANGTRFAYVPAPIQTSPQNGANDAANAGNNGGVYENALSPTEEPGQDNAKNESLHDNNYRPAAGNSLMAESGEEVVVSGNEAVITKGQGSSIPSYVTVNGNRCEVVEIGEGAYADNKSLRSITIPKGVRKIGKNAFYGCTNLRKIKYAGKNVKKIGKKAFSNISRNATSSVPKKVYDKYVKLIKKSKPVKGMKYKKR